MRALLLGALLVASSAAAQEGSGVPDLMSARVISIGSPINAVVCWRTSETSINGEGRESWWATCAARSAVGTFTRDASDHEGAIPDLLIVREVNVPGHNVTAPCWRVAEPKDTEKGLQWRMACARPDGVHECGETEKRLACGKERHVIGPARAI